MIIRDAGFEIICKNCGAKMLVEDTKSYDDNSKIQTSIEIFPNMFYGVTITCAKCCDNSISVSEGK